MSSPHTAQFTNLSIRISMLRHEDGRGSMLPIPVSTCDPTPSFVNHSDNYFNLRTYLDESSWCGLQLLTHKLRIPSVKYASDSPAVVVVIFLQYPALSDDDIHIASPFVTWHAATTR